MLAVGQVGGNARQEECGQWVLSDTCEWRWHIESTLGKGLLQSFNGVAGNALPFQGTHPFGAFLVGGTHRSSLAIA
jgi:hypothetical protein